ncbi:SURF1 family protein [Muricoccus radiodurans]|uniref:SURF1 family protein n=1 Tax=Muricoccus radiodurans TaxID=2231721 RepID=UPI003CEE3368
MAPVAPPRRRVWPAVLAALPVLAVLLTLGTWQVRRLQWKTALLETVAAAEAGPPAPLTANPPELAKLEATGRFLHDRESLLGVEVRNGALGGHLVTPLVTEGLPPLLVDRGWVPLDRAAAPVSRPDGPVRVTGYALQGVARGLFSPADDPAGRRFYTADPEAIGTALGLPGVLPWFLVALAPDAAAPAALPEPARRLPRPNNPHLGYAITWYGLAAALVGVLAAFILSRNRRAEGPASGVDA